MPASHQTCGTCGATTPAGASVCPSCGTPIPGDEPANAFETRLAATLADRYAVQDEIGRGGMALVFRAHDRKHDRGVALKVLRPDVSHELGSERFLREIKLAASLTHPHIVPLYDSGEADGLLYYVMPVIDGESLREVLDREAPLPVTKALAIARDVSSALDYAHRQGIVHRDIKPENILLHDGHAMVTDFGLARAVTAATRTERVTRAGVAIGTPAYMSPEQGAGEDDLDGRTDLYSLGCVLYEMLTGEPPFADSSPRTVIAKRFSTVPPPVASLRRGVPIGTSRMVRRLLAPDPDDRYGTGADVVAVIDNPMGEERAAPMQSIAVLPFANISPDPEAEYFSDGITEEIINLLARRTALRVAPRTSSFALKGKHDDIRIIGERLNVGTVLEGSVRKVGARVRVSVQLTDAAEGRHLWSERYDRELVDLFAIQDEIAGAIATQLEVALTKDATKGSRVAATRLEAYDLYLKGRYHLNQRGVGLQKGLEFFQRAVTLDPTLPQAHAGLSDAYSLLSFYGGLSPLVAAPAAREAASKAIALDSEMAEAHNAAAWLSMAFDWDWERAAAGFKRAIELNPAFVTSRLWYAAFLGFVMGQLDEAMALVKNTLGLDPLSTFARVHLAALLITARRYEDAIDVLEEALAQDTAFFLTHRYLSVAHRLNGEADRGLASAETGARVTGGHPWATADVIMCRAALGDLDGASQLYAQLVDRRKRHYVQATLLTFTAGRLGRLDEALAWFETACRERDATAVLYIWPDFDPIRTMPRFHTVLDEVGLRVPADSAIDHFPQS